MRWKLNLMERTTKLSPNRPDPQDPTQTLDDPFKPRSSLCRSPLNPSRSSPPRPTGSPPQEGNCATAPLPRESDTQPPIQSLLDQDLVKSSLLRDDEPGDGSENEKLHNLILPSKEKQPKTTIEEKPKSSSAEKRQRRNKARQEKYLASQKENDEKRNFAKYYIIKLSEGSFLSNSPFKIEEEIVKALGGRPAELKFIREDTIHIMASKKEQIEKILSLKSILSRNVNAQDNFKLNTSKGVITSKFLRVCSEGELLDRLRSEGVISVRRLTKKQNGASVTTDSLLLTFSTPVMPTFISPSMLLCNIKVRPYIPPPIRCFKCLKFGHISTVCRSTIEMCACGLSKHDRETTPCINPPSCVNCGELHSSLSGICKVFVQEKEIQRIKVINKLTMSEAKALVTSQTFTNPRISYASKIASSGGPNEQLITSNINEKTGVHNNRPQPETTGTVLPNMPPPATIPTPISEADTESSSSANIDMSWNCAKTRRSRRRRDSGDSEATKELENDENEGTKMKKKKGKVGRQNSATPESLATPSNQNNIQKEKKGANKSDAIKNSIMKIIL